MSLESLKSNIAEEKKLFNLVQSLVYKSGMSNNPSEKKAISDTVNSISQQMIILNNSIPHLLNNISIIKEMPSKKQSKKNEKKELISLELRDTNKLIVIRNKDRAEYIKQLKISERSIKEIGKKHIADEIFANEFKKPSKYVKFANSIFLKTSQKLTDNGKFSDLKKALVKGNFSILPNSYLSVMLLTTLIFFFVGIILTILLLFINISFEVPFILLNDDILGKIPKIIWIIPVLPISTFLIMYLYPSAEKSNIKGNIDSELPFVTIQMSAIAGADIEPSNIFKIIAMNKEYPSIKQEAKKIMNQINLYGYDLVTALRNVSIASPSEEWAELLNGFSTTIRSGGDLSKYLTKKAESMLFGYRLKREKETKSAETFMNIYISIVIAAPMLLMLVLVMLNISGLGFQMSVPVMTLVVVSIVSLINIIFLAYLQVNQRRG